jgi:hypothetical protein
MYILSSVKVFPLNYHCAFLPLNEYKATLDKYWLEINCYAGVKKGFLKGGKQFLINGLHTRQQQ